MRPCLHPRCPVLVVRGYCPPHAAARARLKEQRNPWRAVYRSPAWRACMREVRARAGDRCEVMEDGVRCPVTSVLEPLQGNHFPVSCRELWEAGLDPCDPGRVKLCCARHHGLIDAARRTGGPT